MKKFDKLEIITIIVCIIAIALFVVGLVVDTSHAADVNDFPLDDYEWHSHTVNSSGGTLSYADSSTPISYQQIIDYFLSLGISSSNSTFQNFFLRPSSETSLNYNFYDFMHNPDDFSCVGGTVFVLPAN